LVAHPQHQNIGVIDHYRIEPTECSIFPSSEVDNCRYKAFVLEGDTWGTLVVDNKIDFHLSLAAFAFAAVAAVAMTALAVHIVHLSLAAFAFAVVALVVKKALVLHIHPSLAASAFAAVALVVKKALVVHIVHLSLAAFAFAAVALVVVMTALARPVHPPSAAFAFAAAALVVVMTALVRPVHPPSAAFAFAAAALVVKKALVRPVHLSLAVTTALVQHPYWVTCSRVIQTWLLATDFPVESLSQVMPHFPYWQERSLFPVSVPA